jgi:hypothetical protein
MEMLKTTPHFVIYNIFKKSFIFIIFASYGIINFEYKWSGYRFCRAT